MDPKEMKAKLDELVASYDGSPEWAAQAQEACGELAGGGEAADGSKEHSGPEGMDMAGGKETGGAGERGGGSSSPAMRRLAVMIVQGGGGRGARPGVVSR